jgi:DNA-binding NtrC family response regulator
LIAVSLNVKPSEWKRDVLATLDTGVGKRLARIGAQSGLPKVLVQSKLPARAFVVDDELATASTIASIRTLQGFNVRFFLSPLDVVDASRVEGCAPLISDLVMPPLSGPDLAIKIRGMQPACLVLSLSGQAHTDNLLTVTRKDGCECPLLAKPFSPVEPPLENQRHAVANQPLAGCGKTELTAKPNGTEAKKPTCLE